MYGKLGISFFFWIRKSDFKQDVTEIVFKVRQDMFLFIA